MKPSSGQAVHIMVLQIGYRRSPDGKGYDRGSSWFLELYTYSSRPTLFKKKHFYSLFTLSTHLRGVELSFDQ